jgi:hypothetical protein
LTTIRLSPKCNDKAAFQNSDKIDLVAHYSTFHVVSLIPLFLVVIILNVREEGEILSYVIQHFKFFFKLVTLKSLGFPYRLEDKG